MEIFEQNNHSLNTKTGKILDNLQKYGYITSWDAINMYHATRLSAIIFNLRKEGYNIESETETSDVSKGVHWTKYRYKGKA